MSKGLNNVFDWILKRKRCPFCVEPFPVLKCSSFEGWQCPKCDTEFCLDDEGDLEPIFSEGYYGTSQNHFLKTISTSSTQSNILCSNCTEKQQKIIQLLQSFDSSRPRKEYELYAGKLESRYPLCSTCSFRVSAHLKGCEEAASMDCRRNTTIYGGNWESKIKIAEQMRMVQIKRKLFRGIFFWPDFLFQLVLTMACIFKLQTDDQSFIDSKCMNINVKNLNLSVWLPETQNLTVSSFYFVICFAMFFIQFNGVAYNGRGFFELIPQFYLLASRVLLGNFLYRTSSCGIDLNLALTLTSISLAVIFKIGSRNSLKGKKSQQFLKASNLIFSKSPVRFPNINSKGHNNNILIPATDKSVFKNGFASYSENQHKYHSFANQVPPGDDKPIMPWSDRPLPGKLNSPKIDENKYFMNFNNNLIGSRDIENYRMRPTKLVSDDPLELEPMFSSFSLSDDCSPTKKRRSSVLIKPNNNSNSQKPQVSLTNSKDNSRYSQVISKQTTQSRFSVFTKDPFSTTYNTLITLMLLISRLYLKNQAPLVAINLALAFGLRGFLWPLLDLKVQVTTLSVAICRLVWLAAVVNGKIGEAKFGYFAMALDFILIILR